MPPTRHLRTRKQLTPPSSAPVVSTRPRRGTVTQAPTTIERSSPDEGRHSSIRLTVKADPRKLKEATSGGKNIAVNSRDNFTGGEIVSGPRQSRKKPIVEESSEEEEDEEDLDAEGEEDVDMLDEEDEEEEESDSDEDLDAEGEEDDDTPLPPGPLPFVKPAVTVTPAQNLLSVEDKEMALDDDDDDELSSLDEDAEGEEDIGEEDAEGEDDDEADSDEISATRDATPDPNKLTRRQRAVFENLDGGLMALSNGKI